MNFDKKGQVTIFIIVAVIIALIVIFFFVLRPNATAVFQSQEINPISYLKSCVEPVIRESVNELSKKGGYSEPEGYIMHNGEKIKYLCYTNNYYETCVVQQPMIKNHFEEELNVKVNTKANECVQSLIEEYRKRNYEVSSSSISSETSIQLGKIVIEVNAPLTISKDETSQSFSKFSVDIDSNMYELLFTAANIIDFESSLGDSATELYLQYYPDIKIYKNNLGDGSTIYKIENVISGESFTFASRSLAWPAGYGFDEA